MVSWILLVVVFVVGWAAGVLSVWLFFRAMEDK